MKRFSIVSQPLRHKRRGDQEVVPLDLPQECVADVDLSVRLEAGSLHLANYLIHSTSYFSLQR